MQRSAENSILARATVALLRRPRAYIAAIIILAGLAAIPLTQVQTSPDLRDFYAQKGAVLAEAERVRALNVGTKPFPIILDAGDRQRVISKAAVLESKRLVARLRTHPTTKAMFTDESSFLGPHRIVEVFVDEARAAYKAGSLPAPARDGRLALTPKDRLQDIATILHHRGPGQASATLARPSFTIENLSQSQIDKIFTWAEHQYPLTAKVLPDLKSRYGLLILHRDRSAIAAWSDRSDGEIMSVVDTFQTGELKLLPFGSFSAEIKRDQGRSGRLLAITALIIATLLAVRFRRVMDVVVPLVGVGIVNIFMFGAAGAFAWKFSLLSIIAPILTLSLGVDYSIHILSRYRSEVAQGAPLSQAFSSAAQSTGGAIFLGAVTTSIGFLANAISPIPAIADFGKMIALGTFASYFVLGLFVLTIRFVLDSRAQKRGRFRVYSIQESSHESRPHRILAQILARPTAVLSVLALATFVAGYSAKDLPSTFDWRSTLSDDSRLYRAAEVLTTHFGDNAEESIEIVIKGKLASATSLAAIARATEILQSHPAAIKADHTPAVVSITAVLERIHSQVPQSDDEVKSTLTRLVATPEIAVSPFLPKFSVRSLLSSDLGTTMIRLRVSGTSGDTSQLRTLTDSARGALAPLRDAGLWAEMTGTPVKRAEVISNMSEDLVRSTGLTLLLCFFVLVIGLRSFVRSLFTVIPVVIVVAWLLGVMALFGFGLNILTVLITTMCIGVGIDFAVHIVHRASSHNRHGRLMRGAIDDTVAVLLRPMWGSALTTALGFSVLLVAPQAYFRILATLICFLVGFCFLVSTVLMPILLRAASTDIKRVQTDRV